MLSRLKTVDGEPENVDLGLGLFRDVVAGCCTSVEGFRAGYFLVDRDTGRTVTLTLWSDPESLTAGRENLMAALDADEAAAATVRRINAQGVRFDTFEVAAEIGPAR